MDDELMEAPTESSRKQQISGYGVEFWRGDRRWDCI